MTVSVCRAFSIPRARLSRNLEQAISDSNLETGRNGSKSQVKSPGLSGRVDSPVRSKFRFAGMRLVGRYIGLKAIISSIKSLFYKNVKVFLLN